MDFFCFQIGPQYIECLHYFPNLSFFALHNQLVELMLIFEVVLTL